MSKLDEHLPAPYPATDHAEVSAINELKVLLSSPHLKLDIKERDKVPNYDGFVEVLDSSLRSLGKIEVQVKSLNDKDRSRRGYSCEKKLLAYAMKAPLPFVLLAVSAAHREAYWVELTRALCKSLIASSDGATVTVRFPEENFIIPGRQDGCVAEWRRIATVHVEKVISFDEMESEVQRLRKLDEALSEVGNGLPVNDAVGLAEIQEHLAELNALLKDEFAIVKTTFFPDAWQIGLAFAEYTDTSAAYCYFPVRRGSNDVLVKRLSLETFRSLPLSRSAWHRSNPIKQDPVAHAREYVRTKVETIIEANAFAFTDDALIRELLFAVCDELSAPLGLARKDSYSIDELLFAWNTYLPNWVCHVFETTPEQSLRGVVEGSTREGYLKLEGLRFAATSMAGRRSLEAIDAEVRQRIAQRVPSYFPMPIGTRDLPLRHVLPAITRLSLAGNSTISRLYRAFDFGRPRTTGTIFDWLSYEDLVENVRIFYRSLPDAFNHVVAANFPRLRRPPTYWDEFDRMIVEVEPGQPEPHLREWLLKGGQEKRIDVVARGAVALPQGWPDTISWDGAKYEVVEAGSSRAAVMFRRQPLLTEVRSVLGKRFASLERFLR